MPITSDPQWQGLGPTRYIECPACHAAQIPLEPRLNPDNPGGPLKLVGSHGCLNLPWREVYETDYVPAEGPAPAKRAKAQKEK